MKNDDIVYIPYAYPNESIINGLKNKAKERGIEGKISTFSFIIDLIIKQLIQIILIISPFSGVSVFLNKKRGVSIGKNVFIGKNVTFDSIYPDKIIICDNVGIAGNCTIMAHSRPSYINKNVFRAYVKSVIIDEYAWICVGSIILPGVKIGRNSVVMAGSVVTSDIPAYSIAQGNPAKIISKIPKNLILK